MSELPSCFADLQEVRRDFRKQRRIRQAIGYLFVAMHERDAGNLTKQEFRAILKEVRVWFEGQYHD